MQAIKCELTAYRVVKINSEIGADQKEYALTLTIDNKLQCSMPRDEEDLFGFLDIETKIYSTNDGKFEILIHSQSIFSFDKKPVDFEKVMVEQCFPIAQARVVETVKQITAAMGIEPLDISKSS